MDVWTTATATKKVLWNQMSFILFIWATRPGFFYIVSHSDADLWLRWTEHSNRPINFIFLWKKFETRQFNVIYEEIVWSRWLKIHDDIEWTPLVCHTRQLNQIHCDYSNCDHTNSWCWRFWFNLWQVHDVISKVHPWNTKRTHTHTHHPQRGRMLDGWVYCVL